MKVLATEIKIGNTVKYGNLWGSVTNGPVQSKYAANEVEVAVVVAATKIRRREGVEKVPAHETVFSYRKSTFVTAK